MPKTTTANQSSNAAKDSNTAAAAAGGGSAGGGGTSSTTPPQSPRVRRKKMLSFEPNRDFFVVDSTAVAAATTPQGAGAASSSSGGNRDDSNRMMKRQHSHEKNKRIITSPPSPLSSQQPTLMGPIMHRKRVLSMPLCSDASNDFFLPPSSAPTIIEEIVGEDGTVGSSSSQVQSIQAAAAVNAAAQMNRPRNARMRQNTAPISGRGFFDTSSSSGGGAPHNEASAITSGGRRSSPRKKTNSFMANILARRAVAMDLLPANDADLGMYEFFHPMERGTAAAATATVPVGLEQYGEETKEEEEEGDEDLETGAAAVDVVGAGEEDEEEEEVLSQTEDEKAKKKKKLFKPLIFAPRRVMPGGGGGGHGHHGGGGGHGGHPHGGGGAFCDIVASTTQEGQDRDAKPVDDVIIGDKDKGGTILDASEAVPLTTAKSEEEEEEDDTPSSSDKKQHDDFIEDGEEEDEVDLQKQYDDSHIIRATKKDYFFTGFLIVVMASLVGVVVGWPTHLDESDSIFGPVGLACKTPCRGDVYDQDYFHGYNRFHAGDVIYLTPHIDATLTEESYLRMSIRGVESNQTKWTSSDTVFGPASVDGKRVTKETRVTVNWENPEEQHVIDVWSTTGSQELPPPYQSAVAHSNASTKGESHEADSSHRGRVLSAASTADTLPLDVPHHGELTYTLHASTLSPLAAHSVLIAALIMIFVYIFILLEVIHRTLVALFGSFVALFFLFLMHGGHTESISTIMLHMEWSTLGLLFGMMLLVGELSHTGIFEWCAVRLLVASKGSFNRLMVLLCALVALSSAFLDNVTTMLLIAPVTIDMCGILGVDPRPYLIGEVLLSNVGGTATMIGDPPNIIIGSSFEEIGFVDFIINILPCIFFFAVPVSIFLVLKIYKYYLTSEKMVTLDVGQLKKTYQVYDEPRLLIAGTSTCFVILMFFLHPLHHKDTAWIALLGAFITIAFTNPHDVQDALRNHVEWDTLLFFAGLFVLVEVCAAMGLLQAIGDALASVIKSLPEESQLSVAITLIIWVSAITSAFLDNIPYTATMIPVVRVLADELPQTLDITILAWALSFGACLGGNGTLLGASANIVTAGLSTSKGYGISFLNFLYPGMITTIVTVAIANVFMLVVYVWV